MTLVFELFQIITLQRTPQDLRYDQVAAAISFASLIAMSFYINAMETKYSEPLGYAIVHWCSQAAAIYGLLKWRHKTMRYVQTITALFGTTVILQVLTLLALQSSLFAVTSLFFSVWNVYLMVIILRAALDSSTLQSVVYTVGYHFVTVLILILIYPDFPAEITAIIQPSNTGT